MDIHADRPEFRPATMLATVACAGLMLAASMADAAPVNSGIVNLTVPATTAGLYLNVVTGVSGGTPGGAPGWDINVWGTSGLGFFSPASPAGGAYATSALNVVTNQAVGALIDGTRTFGAGGVNMTAQWNLNSSDNLFGFRFLNEGTNSIHYGWGRLRIGASVLDRTIVEYGYEDVAGAGITVGGAAVTPEPGTLALAALGLGGLLLARRRRQS